MIGMRETSFHFIPVRGLAMEEAEGVLALLAADCSCNPLEVRRQHHSEFAKQDEFIHGINGVLIKERLYEDIRC
jgi:hypothetical protein